MLFTVKYYLTACEKYRVLSLYFEEHSEYAGDYDEDDFALDDCNDYNDYLSYGLGWVKFNSGTFYDDRYYLVLPRTRMTNNQFRTLENLLEDTFDKVDNLLVLPWVTSSITYYSDRHSARSIIKSLQKFYTSGVLEESVLNEASIDPEGKYTDFGTGKVTSDNIFDDRTHVPFYDQLFTKPDYMAKEYNLKGHIEMMSPKEYYEECANKIFNSSFDSLVKGRKNDTVVNDEIKEIIVKYKRQVFLPYLNYAEQNQEGLHRMLVAAEIFGWDHKFPVLIIEWVDEELAIQRKKAKEEDRVRRYIKQAVEDTLHYTFDKIEEFTDECKSQVEYKFDFIEEPINSFSVRHNGEDTEVEVNNVVYTFDTDLIKIVPREEDDIEDVNDIELDDLDLDLDFDEFLKKYGIG